MTALGGLDAAIFTGGIGENSRTIRRLILEGLEPLGIVLDKEKNNQNATLITSGPVKALVVPTNEELAIARDTAALFESMRSQPAAASEHAVLTQDEKADLVLLWANNPDMNPYELVTTFNQKTGKRYSVAALANELKALGLDEVSKSKRAELASKR